MDAVEGMDKNIEWVAGVTGEAGWGLIVHLQELFYRKLIIDKN